MSQSTGDLCGQGGATSREHYPHNWGQLKVAVPVALWAQVAYVAAGAGYNAASLVRTRRGRAALSPTDPVRTSVATATSCS